MDGLVPETGTGSDSQRKALLHQVDQFGRRGTCSDGSMNKRSSVRTQRDGYSGGTEKVLLPERKYRGLIGASLIGLSFILDRICDGYRNVLDDVVNIFGELAVVRLAPRQQLA